jgi:hypothetical protein
MELVIPTIDAEYLSNDVYGIQYCSAIVSLNLSNNPPAALVVSAMAMP